MPTMRLANLLASALLVASAHAFSLAAASQHTRMHTRMRPSRSSSIEASGLRLTSPSEKEIADQAMRDWLPTKSRSPYSEKLPQDAIRYVYEGSGTVSADGKEYKVKPNTLVKIEEPTLELLWTPDGGELVVNTPEYWSAERIAARNLLPTVTPILSGAAVLAILYIVVVGY